MWYLKCRLEKNIINYCEKMFWLNGQFIIEVKYHGCCDQCKKVFKNIIRIKLNVFNTYLMQVFFIPNFKSKYPSINF